MGEMDFSIAALFLRAHWVVQAVMIILLIASFWSWAVIVDKWLALRKARRGQVEFESEFWSGRPLDDLYDRIAQSPDHAAEKVFVAGMREWRRSFQPDGTMTAGAQHRIDRAMSVATDREVERIERWMGFLATVGSIAPFVGLFGTVWGIKNSFEAIAVSQNTSLAVVAPGIAEALVATALGLFAAIPAVIAYNALSDRVNRMAGRLDNFADEFSALLSRQIGRQSS